LSPKREHIIVPEHFVESKANNSPAYWNELILVAQRFFDLHKLNNLTMQQFSRTRIGWAGSRAAGGVSAQQPSPAQPPSTICRTLLATPDPGRREMYNSRSYSTTLIIQNGNRPPSTLCRYLLLHTASRAASYTLHVTQDIARKLPLPFDSTTPVQLDNAPGNR
jgi:hypothetical protein